MKNKNIVQCLSRSSQQPGAWLLMALTACSLILTALYFQHIMLLPPCVMCIYERCALFGILGASLLGALSPKSPLRYMAILLWVYSAWEGVRLAWQHTLLQLHASPFYTCDFFVSFPSWLPLDRWIPALFRASGYCSVTQWQFLSLGMPQWLVGIFAAYLLVGLLVLFSQFSPTKKT